VVEDQVFACEIESEADDYRYGYSAIEPVELPRDTAARCVRLAARLELAVAGIDLRRTPAGEWFCFEANPSPAFACFGARVADAVADAVARLLIERSAPLAERDRGLPGGLHRDHAAPVARAL
jgi:glutathione synthase/RimK-type ligase-like ATP-grasp enzyme